MYGAVWSIAAGLGHACRRVNHGLNIRFSGAFGRQGRMLWRINPV